MVRVWSTLLVLVVAALVVVNMASAQEKKGKGGGDPGARFDAMEKAAGHDPLKGVLTKDEFIKAMKEGGSKMADRAEQMYERMTKADPNKVTKDEYVAFMKEMAAKGGGGKKGGKRPQ